MPQARLLDPVKKLTFSKIEGIRRRGRPATRWLDSVEKDMKVLGVEKFSGKSSFLEEANLESLGLH